jgi:hypothetical protein
LTLEDGTDSLSQSVGNNQSALHNIPEEQKFNLHRSGSLKAGTSLVFVT